MRSGYGNSGGARRSSADPHVGGSRYGMRSKNKGDSMVQSFAPDGCDRTEITAAGQPRASRAAQFMPFAALTGYYELARQQERVTEPRHVLTEEEAVELSRTITQIKRGDLIRVTYYDWDAYRTMTGAVARIDTTFRRLQVIKTIIPFDDIRSIERDAPGRQGVH